MASGEKSWEEREQEEWEQHVKAGQEDLYARLGKKYGMSPAAVANAIGQAESSLNKEKCYSVWALESTKTRPTTRKYKSLDDALDEADDMTRHSASCIVYYVRGPQGYCGGLTENRLKDLYELEKNTK